MEATELFSKIWTENDKDGRFAAIDQDFINKIIAPAMEAYRQEFIDEMVELSTDQDFLDRELMKEDSYADIEKIINVIVKEAKTK